MLSSCFYTSNQCFVSSIIKQHHYYIYRWYLQLLVLAMGQLSYPATPKGTMLSLSLAVGWHHIYSPYCVYDSLSMLMMVYITIAWYVYQMYIHCHRGYRRNISYSRQMHSVYQFYLSISYLFNCLMIITNGLCSSTPATISKVQQLYLPCPDHCNQNISTNEVKQQSMVKQPQCILTIHIVAVYCQAIFIYPTNVAI